MVRPLLAVFCLASGLAPLPGATLQSLTLEEMACKATAIVRGRVSGSYSAAQGSSISTHYQIQVLERWKGANGSTVDLMLPGGAASGYRQSFSGIPQLSAGNEYVLFLWTGKSGITQLIGLSQGAFDVIKSASGELMATRSATSELMLNAEGKAVLDQPFQMRLADMSSAVSKALARSAAK
ncbi:MAG: hypothetical protein M3Z36_00210 [Acidobacteriota bacterium]|nr:hypothetical protein [Acidobacteriota bacterium]